MELDKSRAAAQRRIAKALSEVGFALPGSLTVRSYRCGKANCRCHSEPPQLHGPYASWTRKVNSKTVTRLLTEDQLADYKPLFDNAQRLRELVNELQELSLQIIEADARRPERRTKTKEPSASAQQAPRSRRLKSQTR